MRTKTDARREAFLAAAANEFRERGYKGASISAIVARTGGSKQTIYNYFSSKDELFVEVVSEYMSYYLDSAYDTLNEIDDFSTCLHNFGIFYLKMRQVPECISTIRLAYGEAGRTDIGRLVYERGRRRGIATVKQFLETAMARGKLCLADPTVAACHLFGLLDGELIEPLMLGYREPASEGEIVAVVDRAIRSFLIAYAPPAPGLKT